MEVGHLEHLAARAAGLGIDANRVQASKPVTLEKE